MLIIERTRQMAKPFNNEHPRFEELSAALVIAPQPETAAIEAIVVHFISISDAELNAYSIEQLVGRTHPMLTWMVKETLRYLLDNGCISIDGTGIIKLSHEMISAKLHQTTRMENEELARLVVYQPDEPRATKEIRAIRYILGKEPRSVLEFVLMDRLEFSISEYLSYKRFMDGLIDRGLVLRIKKDNENAYCLSTGFHLLLRQQQYKKNEQETNKPIPVRPGSLYTSSIPPINPHLFEATIKVKGVEIDLLELKNLYNLANKHTEDPSKYWRSIASGIGRGLEHNELMALYAHLKKLGLFETTN